jgi:hypothetical protein
LAMPPAALADYSMSGFATLSSGLVACPGTNENELAASLSMFLPACTPLFWLTAIQLSFASRFSTLKLFWWSNENRHDPKIVFS